LNWYRATEKRVVTLQRRLAERPATLPLRDVLPVIIDVGSPEEYVFLWVRVGRIQNVGGPRFSHLPVLT
jgi:hypothetical protein